MTATTAATTQRSAALELFLVALMFVAASGLAAVFQEPIRYNEGRGFDGVAYCQMAEQFARGERPATSPPFVYRVAVPLLVSRVAPGDVLGGFRSVGLVANALTVALLLVWLRRTVRDWRARVAVCGLFIAAWHGPVRFLFHYAAIVDYWAFAVLLAELVLLDAVRRSVGRARDGVLLLFAVVAFAGALVRETSLVVPAALLLAGNPLRRGAGLGAVARRVPLAFVLPLVAGLFGLLATRLVAVPVGDYSFVETATTLLYGKSLAGYLLAWCIAYGPALFLVLYDWRSALRTLYRRQYLLAVLAAFALLAWVGGADTERMLFSAAPVVYALAAGSLERNARALGAGALAALAAAQLVASRVLWTMPDPSVVNPHPLVVLTPLGNRVGPGDLFSYFASPAVGVAELAQYALLFAALAAWARTRAARTGRGAP